MNDTVTHWFGVFSVTLMVTSYAAEQRGPGYIALFAFACVLSATYALLLGSYPFVFAEAVWAVIAFRRYRSLIALDVWKKCCTG
ncbi:MAG: hypothetical protein AB8B86_11600 [Pseudomonadales bacterium]